MTKQDYTRKIVDLLNDHLSKLPGLDKVAPFTLDAQGGPVPGSGAVELVKWFARFKELIKELQ